MNLTKDKIIEKIKSRNIYHKDIPEELQNDMDIIVSERVSGLRESKNRGFDVIHQRYFIHEKILISKKQDIENWDYSLKTFDIFDDYYEYLAGNIYDNACYFQCKFPKSKYKIDKTKFYNIKTLINDTIDDYILEPSEEEKKEYFEREVRKKKIKKWVERFNKCDTYKKLMNTINSYKKSNLYKVINLEFYFWNYIFYDLNDKNRFNIIMQYMSTGMYPEWEISRYLCSIYDPDEVVAAYDCSYGSYWTRAKHNRDMKNYAEKAKTGKKEVYNNIFFDSKTHYYFVGQHKWFGIKRYFETIEELIDYTNYDLSDADFSKVIGLEYDFSKCKTNNNTKLPIGYSNNYKYIVKKVYEDGIFRVKQFWYDDNDILIKETKNEFQYFFNFISFLKGNLSDADLSMCEGLLNLENIDGLNFNGANLSSVFCDKFGITYDAYSLDSLKTESFEITEKNEKSTELVLQSSREMIDITKAREGDLYADSFTKNRIYYISDLHIVHKILSESVKNESDLKIIVKKIVNNLVNESRGVLLIVGDTACDFSLFELFVKCLREEIDRKRVYTKVIFILGNHELWDFANKSIDIIVNNYQELINRYNMFLLQNNILYMDDDRKWNYISEDELCACSKDELRNRLKEARLIFFGGIAFSGENNTFNADNGIYRFTIDRKTEIAQSREFKELYKKVIDTLYDKRVVVCTHMPMECWSKEVEYNKNFIYVSGHTHKNYFYDDGEIRIYADNQIGYNNNNPHTKYFELENDYDYMSDYTDGIYTISADDYKRFIRGKNIMMDFNWQIYKLYMLKKNGYYCFIHESKGGSLTILNGGAKQLLNRNRIEYYFDNMDKIITTIKKPLDKYSAVQNKIANEIKKFGGSGNVHGCIIDIDFYNHIFVNPIDLKLTPYYAEDMIYKKVYADIPQLLEKRCPELYVRYTKLIGGKNDNLPMVSSREEKRKVKPVTYLDTDIYSASREIKKMQKLSSNILTVWDEVSSSNKMIEKRRNIEKGE